MVRTVYIETTIPSYYYETRRTPMAVAWQQVTREWWDRHRFDTNSTFPVMYWPN